MVNLYFETNNKVKQYYNVSPVMARMIENILNGVDTIEKTETEDGYWVEIKKIHEDET